MANPKFEIRKGPDLITIEILPDGTVRSDSGKISAPNHESAEQFLRTIAELTGGKSVRTRKGHAHTHSHAHEGQKHDQ